MKQLVKICKANKAHIVHALGEGVVDAPEKWEQIEHRDSQQTGEHQEEARPVLYVLNAHHPPNY